MPVQDLDLARVPTDARADVSPAFGQADQRLAEGVVQWKLPSEAAAGPGPTRGGTRGSTRGRTGSTTGSTGLGNPSTRGIDVPTPRAFALDDLPGPRAAAQGAQHRRLELDDAQAGGGLLGRHRVGAWMGQGERVRSEGEWDGAERLHERVVDREDALAEGRGRGEFGAARDEREDFDVGGLCAEKGGDRGEGEVGDGGEPERAETRLHGHGGEDVGRDGAA